jgi:hypothetical protein
MQTSRDVAVGVFNDPDAARDALRALKDAGFSGEDISVLMPDRGDARDVAREAGTKAGEGAGTGAVAGGILGGLTGWLVGVGALAIPGVGPLIAAGAFASALTGAAVGAGAGAIAGALIGMGLPEPEAKEYEQQVRSGRTLVVVRAGNRAAEAERIMMERGAYNMQHPMREPTGRSVGTGRMDPTDRGRYDRPS